MKLKKIVAAAAAAVMSLAMLTACSGVFRTVNRHNREDPQSPDSLFNGC